MLDPRELYTVRDEVVAELAGHRPVLLVQLDGFVDAGQAGRQVTSHVLEHLDHEVLAEFDHDQLHDYRSRRPAMTFDTSAWTSYAEVHLRLHRVTDEQGEVFLLLSGPEPDVQWERVVEALLQLVELLGVRLVVSLHGIPMAVPHTRPSTFTAHATDPALVQGHRSWIDRVEVPASFAALLEWRLGQRDRQAMGFAVHVPHYLAQSSYPNAAITLAQQLSASTGLHLPMEPLEKSATENLAEITAEMSDSTEVRELIGSLERQYDVLQTEGVGQVPSAEEIGAEFERFLAEQDDGTDPGKSPDPRDRED